jgi:hypothetical protein
MQCIALFSQRYVADPARAVDNVHVAYSRLRARGIKRGGHCLVSEGDSRGTRGGTQGVLKGSLSGLPRHVANSALAREDEDATGSAQRTRGMGLTDVACGDGPSHYPADYMQGVGIQRWQSAHYMGTGVLGRTHWSSHTHKAHTHAQKPAQKPAHAQTRKRTYTHAA